MKTHPLLVCALLATAIAGCLAPQKFAVPPVAAEPRANPFEMPRHHNAHTQLNLHLRAAIEKKDHAAMAEATRLGMEHVPGESSWTYNHACALALLGDKAGALEFLAKSIGQGFTNAAHIEADEDFASLRKLPAFKELVQAAREARPPMEFAVVSTNDFTALISQTNTVWDLNSGVFRSYFVFPKIEGPAWDASAYRGAMGEKMREWAKEGTAAGLYGVLYDNRCGGHSMVDVGNFPGLARVVYGDEARELSLDRAQARFFYNAAVVGNASVAHTDGPFWRSVPRMITSDAHSAGLAYAMHMSNHLYVYPCHTDYRPTNKGDVFVANNPCVVTSLGSSGSDQVFLRAILSAMGAFTPEVRAHLAQTGRLGPALNYLLRKTQRHLETEEDYYTGKAHRPALDGAHVHADEMVRLAHEMATNTVPPLVGVRLDSAPPVAKIGVECFDAHGGELAWLVPVAGSFIMRSLAQKRSFRFTAIAPPPGVTDAMQYRWEILQAPAGCVEIKFLNQKKTEVEITLTHPSAVPWPEDPDDENSMPTSRVDIGVFVHNGVHASPPAILSFYYLMNEEREYGANGRLVKVDYASKAGEYADPVYTHPKRWVDAYQYDAAGGLLGWERRRGENVEAFTPDGFKIEARDNLGRATSARVVEYKPSEGGGELLQGDTPQTVAYAYENPGDLRGSFTLDEPATENVPTIP